MKQSRKTANEAIRSAMAEPLHLPLSPGVPIYAYGGPSTRLGSRWTVTFGTTQGWSTTETCRALKTKVKKAWAIDQESEPEFSGLAGNTLSKCMGASSQLTNNALDPRHFAAGLRTSYVLILSDQQGPVGFCTFAVVINYSAVDEQFEFEVEVLEAFIEPRHRDVCRSHDFCVVIAQFAINALEEFNDRLFKAGARFAEGVTLNIVGDVESRAGERFLFSVEKEFKRRADESEFDDCSVFQLCGGFSIETIEVDPRW
ncbi:hypothetical protein [Paraburkholderia caribensis]|uniref:hypothetical protein n=1 Tax=Paraburkholderia caribensis TaxID=75105 RepID=UPI001CAF9366|nr:hypothetical protein [Paraburkholderia caribensis]CAG9269796.1 hypothetical protein PCAR4_830134 [Paraburkholderia caribensis]